MPLKKIIQLHPDFSYLDKAVMGDQKLAREQEGIGHDITPPCCISPTRWSWYNGVQLLEGFHFKMQYLETMVFTRGLLNSDPPGCYNDVTMMSPLQYQVQKQKRKRKKPDQCRLVYEMWKVMWCWAPPALQVQIARVKSERAEAARKASYHYQQQLLHEEQWIPLECFGLQVVTMTTIFIRL